MCFACSWHTSACGEGPLRRPDRLCHQPRSLTQKRGRLPQRRGRPGVERRAAWGGGARSRGRGGCAMRRTHIWPVNIPFGHAPQAWVRPSAPFHLHSTVSDLQRRCSPSACWRTGRRHPSTGQKALRARRRAVGERESACVTCGTPTGRVVVEGRRVPPRFEMPQEKLPVIFYRPRRGMSACMPSRAWPQGLNPSQKTAPLSVPHPCSPPSPGGAGGRSGRMSLCLHPDMHPPAAAQSRAASLNWNWFTGQPPPIHLHASTRSTPQQGCL